ncbi:hypothetical protein [Bradyrhizobium acaciae]|uniref:hypothetical protein n=1 Tax=Bradyrhizobium acaciae TaxID=2683706 RepID=UPI001E2FE5A5|nr:hypothetical protein [Bradyrhizobium acaciae]MCC8978908.1 hypothetical protein [Bradyrhizobium acaciae]
MISTEELLYGLSPDLTLRFFATFARMEFALKQLRLLRSTAEGEVAQIGHPRLVARLGPGFFQAVEEAHVAEMLIANPPKHFLVNGDGGVAFGPQPAALVTTSDLIGATWRVRNNLFHGNKLSPADRKRDEALMTNALAVLDMILEALPDVSSSFHEPQQHF